MKKNSRPALPVGAAAVVVIVAILVVVSMILRKKEPKPAAEKTVKPGLEEVQKPFPEEEVSSALEPEKRKTQGNETDKNRIFDYRIDNELKSHRAQLSLLGLSEATLNEVLYALEVRLYGNYEAGLVMLESLFTGATETEKPQLGMLLIQQYLNFGKITRAEEIAGILKQDFGESAFPHLARAYIDMINGRTSPAFEAIKQTFELGKNDKNAFLWFGIFGWFHGTEEQEQQIEDWLAEYRKLHPGNVAILLAGFNYYQGHWKEDALTIFQEFEKVCQDKELLLDTMHKLAWGYGNLGNLPGSIEVLRRSLELDPENPQSRISLAYFLNASGDTGEAVAQLEETLNITQATSMKAEIHRHLSEYYRKLGERDKMMAANQEALRLDPDSPHNFISLAESYVHLGELEKAIESCRQGIALKDKVGVNYWALSSLYQQLARIYEEKKEPEQCLEYLEKACEAKVAYGFDVYQEFFRKYAHYKSPDALIEKAKELSQKHPDNPYLYSTLGNFCRNQGRYDEAIGALQKAIDVAEMDLLKAWYTANMVQTYLAKDETEQARGLAEKATADFPYSFISYATLGMAYEKTENYEKALHQYETAAELASAGWQKSGPLQGMARMYDKLGDTGKAIETYRELMEVSPSQWTANQLAQYYEKQEMYDDAIAASREAIKYSREPQEIGAGYERIARIQLRQEKQADAIKTIKDYVNAYSEDPHAYFRLGMIYRQVKDYRSAETAYREAVALAGENKRQKLVYLDRLVDMQANEAGEQDEAIQTAGEMIEIDPDYGKGYERLAAIYASQERFDKAAETYETIATRAAEPENWRYVVYSGRAALNYAKGGWENRALSLAKEALGKAPENFQLNQNLGDVYSECRHYNDALRFYQKALELAPEGNRKSLEQAIEKVRKEMAIPVEKTEE